MAAYNEEKNTAVICEKVSVILSVLLTPPHISAQKQHPSPAAEPGGSRCGMADCCSKEQLWRMSDPERSG